MERFLICKNPVCLFLIDLREKDNRILRRPDLFIDECPECGREWSSQCPFCFRSLDVVWREQLPRCSHCLKELKAQPTQNEPEPRL